MKDAPPEVFDAWIRQYVEMIVNVDVSKWEVFHRWHIINDVIAGGLLELFHQGDETYLLEVKAEEKTSVLVPVEIAQPAQEA